MKRVFVVLLFGLILLYAHEGYDTYLSAYHSKERITGILSDIATEVTAIPLQPADGKTIEKARDIKKEGNDLFLISDDMLYRYNKDGRFICRITDSEEMKVAGYLINPGNEELIVLGNTNDVFYYNYNGDLIEKKKLENELPDRRILSVSLHNNRIFSVEENCYLNPDTQEVLVEKELVTYDTSFQRTGSRKLAFVDFGRARYITSFSQPQLCVNPDTGALYVYNPPKTDDFLLQDTLRLTFSWNQYAGTAYERQTIPVLPVRPAGRFRISSSSRFDDDEMNFTFCYDTQTHAYRNIGKGFTDDYYNTGLISDLKAMDIENQTFCFTQSGEAVKEIFPDHTHSGSTVVFIVKMKEA
ncbi:MAG: 6-bladed beta-propeller [Tannerellaceae bacterium]|jgi:hypothetical protein|nr:6-bladed beta-propeller [Tannerellaceae bacterium]